MRKIAKDAFDAVLGSNQAINGFKSGEAIDPGNITRQQEVLNRTLGGPARSIRGGMETGNWGEAIADAHKKDGAVDPLAVAGSFIGASAAYRVASGGGVYKDKDGNTNLIGVPFI